MHVICHGLASSLISMTIFLEMSGDWVVFLELDVSSGFVIA